MFRKRFFAALVILICILGFAPGVSQAQNGGNFPVPAGRIIIGDDTGLYTILADGSEKTYLVQEEETNCWLRDGTWSPDGSRLLYTRICGGNSPTDWHAADGRTADVLIYDIDSGESIEPAPNEGAYQDYASEWHPDGDSILIYSNRNGDRYNIYQIELESGDTTQLTDYSGDVGHAAYDPTGRYLLYNHYVAETNQVSWVISVLDTTNESEIRVANGLTPHWSPDGQWIAYATRGDTPGETADVFVIPAACVYENTGCDAGADARNITYTPDIAEREPMWSADQTQMIYLRDMNPEPSVISWDVYRQDLRTGRLQNLTSSSDISERNSTWETVADAQQVAVESVLPVVVRVNTSTANLRATDSTSGEIVSVLNQGQIMFVQGANASRDWYQITLAADGTTGWIRNDLFSLVTGSLDSVPEASGE